MRWVRPHLHGYCFPPLPSFAVFQRSKPDSIIWRATVGHHVLSLEAIYSSLIRERRLCVLSMNILWCYVEFPINILTWPINRIPLISLFCVWKPGWAGWANKLYQRALSSSITQKLAHSLSPSASHAQLVSILTTSDILLALFFLSDRAQNDEPYSVIITVYMILYHENTH